MLPVVAESLSLGDIDDLLNEIQHCAMTSPATPVRFPALRDELRRELEGSARRH